jgi:hypothetical protein
MLDLLPDIVQQCAALERDRAQMRRQQGEGVWRQRPQKKIGWSVLELPSKRTCTVQHRISLLHMAAVRIVHLRGR